MSNSPAQTSLSPDAPASFVDSAGPDPLPPSVFGACPIRIRWAAYWYRRAADGSGDGVCLVAYAGGAYDMFLLEHAPGAPAISWDRRPPVLKADYEVLERVWGRPVGDWAPDGSLRVQPDWSGLWDAASRAENGYLSAAGLLWS